MSNDFFIDYRDHDTKGGFYFKMTDGCVEIERHVDEDHYEFIHICNWRIFKMLVEMFDEELKHPGEILK